MYFLITHIPSARTLKVWPLHDNETKEEALNFFLEEEHCKYIRFNRENGFDFCTYDYEEAIRFSSKLEFMIEEIEDETF